MSSHSIVVKPRIIRNSSLSNFFKNFLKRKKKSNTVTINDNNNNKIINRIPENDDKDDDHDNESIRKASSTDIVELDTKTKPSRTPRTSRTTISKKPLSIMGGNSRNSRKSKNSKKSKTLKKYKNIKTKNKI
jgi:hypothetical protein